MQPARTELGRSYLYAGRQVVVIQQWRDPYGTPMIRVRTTDDEPVGEEGLAEHVFLRGAAPLDLPPFLPE